MKRLRWPNGAEYARLTTLEETQRLHNLARRAEDLIAEATTLLNKHGVMRPDLELRAALLVTELRLHSRTIEMLMVEAKGGRDRQAA